MANEDDAFVKQARAGDFSGLEALVRRWEKALLRVAFRIVGQLQDAEEVRQNVFVRLVERPEILPATGKFAPWIQRCVVNEAFTMLRRRGRSRAVLMENVETSPGRVAAESDSSRDAEALCVALDRLRPQQRALLALKYDGGLSLREISEVTQIPHSTVGYQLSKAIEQLKRDLALHIDEGAS